MAFVDWIKIEHITPNKKEVYQLAKMLKLSADDVLGKLIRVWIWADQNTVDGQINVIDCADIDSVTSCPGFGKAMVKAEWLSEHGGGVVFPNFERHNAESSKKRAQNAKYQRSSRGKRQESVSNLSAQEHDKDLTPSSSSSMSSSSSEKDESSREGKASQVFQDLPQALCTEPFRAEWLLWEKYLRDAHGKALQPMMRSPAWHGILERAPLGKESSYGISTIRQAMAAGWKALYPQEGKKQPPWEKAKPTDDKLLLAAKKRLAYCRSIGTSDKDFLDFGPVEITREFKQKALELANQGDTS